MKSKTSLKFSENASDQDKILEWWDSLEYQEQQQMINNSAKSAPWYAQTYCDYDLLLGLEFAVMNYIRTEYALHVLRRYLPSDWFVDRTQEYGQLRGFADHWAGYWTQSHSEDGVGSIANLIRRAIEENFDDL